MKTANDIKKIAVLGAGTMSPGIVQNFATAGYQVSIYCRNSQKFEGTMSILKGNLDTFVEEGLLKQEDLPAINARISITDNMAEAVEGAQLIMEAVVENRDTKQAIFDELDRILPEDTIIASNTSFLNIFELMPERRLPYTVIAHWYAPPQIIPLVEVVREEKTEDNTVDVVLEVLRKSEKTPIVMQKYVPGFVVNRLQMILNHEVFYLLDNGYVTPEDLDLAVKASLMPRGMVIGLVQRFDFTGLDMSARNFSNKAYEIPPENNHPKSLFDRYEAGHYGVKTGKGFYDYSGRTTEEVLAKRDKMLFEAFKSAKKFIDNPV